MYMARKRHIPSFTELANHVRSRLRPPFGIVLGTPGEVADLAACLPEGQVLAFQMDLYPAGRLRELAALGARTIPEAEPAQAASTTTLEVHAAADLWDLPERVQTLLYPVPLGGERSLKLDMVEQAYHALAPHGTFLVLSPYERDDFFPQVLKKVFGKVHQPMETGSSVFWCQRDGDRPRRRHEILFQVRVDEETSLRFTSRPGAFSYGRFDDGARALVDAMEVHPGDRVLDIGCGIGTNGIIAAQRAGPTGFVTFVDSNLRAIALAELNARNLAVPHFETIASATLRELPENAFDVVLANPPYFAQMSIAQLFIDRGRRALRRGGRFFLVTKQSDTIYPLVHAAFGEPEMFEARGYIIFRAGQ
jgi:23S rRNA (guanine1835-N2)-methyltransferase